MSLSIADRFVRHFVIYYWLYIFNIWTINWLIIYYHKPDLRSVFTVKVSENPVFNLKWSIGSWGWSVRLFEDCPRFHSSLFPNFKEIRFVIFLVWKSLFYLRGQRFSVLTELRFLNQFPNVAVPLMEDLAYANYYKESLVIIIDFI